MSNKNNVLIDDKKQFKLVILMSVIIFLVLALGLTYAYFQISVEAGGMAGEVMDCFSVEYFKGGNVTGVLTPLKEGEDYTTDGAVAQVTMYTTCTGVNLTGKLYFTTNDTSTFEFDTGYLKYAVVTGEEVLSTGTIDGTANQVIYDGFTLNRTSTVYKVYFWLDGSYNYTSDKLFSGFIHAEAMLGSDVGSNTEAATTTLTNLGLTSNGILGETEDGTIQFTGTSCSSGCSEATVGIYEAEDDLGKSYYFRGDVENNYVKFGKNSSGSDMYWRIVRINGDGTVRMIYDGTSAHTNGESSTDRQVGTSAYNTSYDDNAYVGYMYGTPASTTYEATHANTNNSTMKTYLEGELTSDNTGWYYENIVSTGYSGYIADAIYCADRTKGAENYEYPDGTIYPNLGYGTSVTEYGVYAYPRSSWDADWNLNYVAPTLKCANENDRFTVEDTIGTVTGNSKNKYPVGLLTNDEAFFAGGYAASNTSYYLYTGQYYWTMSPAYFYVGYANVGNVDSDGYANCYNGGGVNFAGGVRPVVSLRSDAIKYGTGTTTDPFRLTA